MYLQGIIISGVRGLIGKREMQRCLPKGLPVMPQSRAFDFFF